MTAPTPASTNSDVTPAVTNAPAAAVPAPADTNAAPVAPAAPVAAVTLKEEVLKPMLDTAGLVWVNTDADTLRAAREAAAQAGIERTQELRESTAIVTGSCAGGPSPPHAHLRVTPLDKLFG